jgi:hypothetical protein
VFFLPVVLLPQIVLVSNVPLPLVFRFYWTRPVIYAENYVNFSPT